MGRFRRWTTGGVALAGALLVASACSGGTSESPVGAADETSPTTTAAPDEGYVSDLYSDDAAWLCRPDLADDVCHRDLDATAVAADGSLDVQQLDAAEDPPVDCFYVYPTTSADESANSDLQPGEAEEIHTAYAQAARFTASCRVFAPLYHQATLGTISGSIEVPDGVQPWDVAYDDVVDAFRHYVANDSDGRGFVLIGHSQGAALLNRLVAEEIDPDPALRARLVSALLIGWPVAVPEGDVVGGDFQHVPLCEAADQTGCVVSYSTFRVDAPPPENSIFGAVGDDGMQAACVDPAALGGGSGGLVPYLLIDNAGGILGAPAQPFADPGRTSSITTPWVTYPDFLEAECVHDGRFTYLALTVHGDPTDPRTDDIGGDLTPEWGLHVVDVNVALGNLVDLVRTQGAAYATG